MRLTRYCSWFDISGQDSKALERYLGEFFEYVVADCDNANEACPVFSGARERLHWSFEDPSPVEGEGNERLAVFRRGRDEIHARVEEDLMNGGQDVRR